MRGVGTRMIFDVGCTDRPRHDVKRSSGERETGDT